MAKIYVNGVELNCSDLVESPTRLKDRLGPESKPFHARVVKVECTLEVPPLVACYLLPEKTREN